jgi:hypothetical protein
MPFAFLGLISLGHAKLFLTLLVLLQIIHGI